MKYKKYLAMFLAGSMTVSGMYPAVALAEESGYESETDENVDGESEEEGDESEEENEQEGDTPEEDESVEGKEEPSDPTGGDGEGNSAPEKNNTGGSSNASAPDYEIDEGMALPLMLIQSEAGEIEADPKAGENTYTFANHETVRIKLALDAEELEVEKNAATPAETAPAEGVSAETVPVETTPTEIAPAETAPTETTLTETTPAGTTSAEAASTETTPAETASTEAAPTETISTEQTPANAANTETVPAEPAEDGPIIYYTLDGSDPMNGAEGATRMVYREGEPISLTASGETDEQIIVKYAVAISDGGDGYIYSPTSRVTIAFSAAQSAAQEMQRMTLSQNLEQRQTEQTLADGTYHVPLAFKYYADGYGVYDALTGKPNALIETPSTIEVKDGKMSITMKTKVDGTDYVTGFQYRLESEDTFADAEVTDTDGDGNADEVSFTIDYTEEFLVTNIIYTSSQADFVSALCFDFANATPSTENEEEPDTPVVNYGEATHTIRVETVSKINGKEVMDIIQMPENLPEDTQSGGMAVEIAAGSYFYDTELIEKDGEYTLRLLTSTLAMGMKMSQVALVDVDTSTFENVKTTLLPMEEKTIDGKQVYEFFIPIGTEEHLEDPIFMWAYFEDTPFGPLWCPSMIAPNADYLVDLSQEALPQEGNYLVNLKKEIVGSRYQDTIVSYEDVPVEVKDGEATIRLKVKDSYKNKSTGSVYYAIYGRDTGSITNVANVVPVSGEAADYVFLKTNDLRKVIFTGSLVGTNIDNGYSVAVSVDLDSIKENETPETFEFLDSGNYTAEVEIQSTQRNAGIDPAAYFETTNVPLKSESGKMTVSLRMTQQGLDAFQQNFYGSYQDIAVTPIGDTGLNMVDVTLYYKGDTALLRAQKGADTVDFTIRLKEDTIKKIDETSSLVDGTYTVDIMCLKDSSNDVSMSAGYFEKEAVPVRVENGKISMTLTIKTEADGMTNLVEGLKYKLNGKWIDAKPKDAGEFPDGIDRITADIQLASLEEPTYVQIYVTAMGYWATLRLVPDLNTLKAGEGTNLGDMLAVPEVTTNPSTYTGMFPNDETILVTLSAAAEGAEIYYTMDGSAPVVGTAKTFKYTKPFAVTSSSEAMNTVTIKAITYKDGAKSFAKSYDIIFLEKAQEVPITATEAGVYSVPYRIWKAFENDYSMADDVIDGNMIVQVSEDSTGNKTSTYYMSLNARDQNGIIGHLRQLWNIPGSDQPTGSPEDYELDSEKAEVLKTVNEEGLNGVKQDYPKLLRFDRDGAGEGYFYIRVDVDAMGDDHQPAKIVLDWEKATRAALPDGRYSVDYRIRKAFENDYSMADDAIDGPAEVEIREGSAIYTLKVKARNENNIIGHLLQLWNIPGTDAPTGSPADYELEEQKATVKEYVNEVGLDGTAKDYPRVFTLTRNTTGEEFFYVRVDVDAMGTSHQSAKFVPDWSTATWLGENKEDVFVAAPVVQPGKTSAGNNESVSVTITEAAAGSEIYYTTDGSQPTAASQKYTGAFQVTGSNTTVTVKAIAIKDGHTSAISSATVKFSSSASIGGGTTDEIEDGKYWMDFNLWHAYANQASMGNVAFENNRKALVTVKDGVATIEIGTNPVSVSGYTSALKDLRSDEVDIEVLDTDSFTTNTKYDGEAHEFEYITKFSFTVEDLDTEYIDVEISVPYTPMDGISENVGGWIAARFKLDFDNMTKTSGGATLKPSSSAASGSSGASGDAVNTTDSSTGVKIEADAFVFEDGTKFSVSGVTTGNPYTAARNTVGAEFADILLYQISAARNGEQATPSGQVEISIPVPVGADTSTAKLYRIVDADTPADAYATELEYTLSGDGKYFVVKVKELGLFAIGYGKPAAADAEAETGTGAETPAAPAIVGGLTDITGHWAQNVILEAIAKGIMSGTSATTFQPNEPTTRGMFITALGRMEGVQVGMYQGNKFTDVEEQDYFYTYVAWAIANKVARGVNDSQFAPRENLTREQMAVILYNYARVKGFTFTGERKTFTDESGISAYAREAVDAMVRAGIMNGRADGSFDAKGKATRAEVATVLVNFSNKYLQ